MESEGMDEDQLSIGSQGTVGLVEDPDQLIRE